MVKRGIVLGHIISGEEIEVGRAKMDLIVDFPAHNCVKDMFISRACWFLLGIYQRF